MSGARPFIVVGDKTDHGGEVLEGSPKALINGKMIARVGDKVHCPRSRCRGTQTIVEGDPSVIVDGNPAAFHGAKTSCGAVLIASMVDNTIGGAPQTESPPELDWNVADVDRALAAANQSFTPLMGVDGKPVAFADTAAKPVPIPPIDRNRSGVTLIERGIPGLVSTPDVQMGPPGANHSGTQPMFGHEFLELKPRDPNEVMRYLEYRTGTKPSDYFSLNDPAFHQNNEAAGGFKPLILSGHPKPANPSISGSSSRLVGSLNYRADTADFGRSWNELQTPEYKKLTGRELGFSDDSMFIGNLILAAGAYESAYPQGLLYDPLPTGAATRGGLGGYNSNAYVSGLLKAAGYDMSSLPDAPYMQPGSSAPVPIPPQYK